GMATARKFGRPLDVGYLPDQFGHIAQLPQILAGFGFRTAALWRGVDSRVTRNRFLWEAPDGSSLLTAYLPNGYSNGANLPLESVESFLTRVSAIAERERKFAVGTPILVMNGTDHAPPDARLMARIREARETSATTFEVGPLQDIINRFAELPLDGTPTHRGELRSPHRAHLLPGVTSARTWIKQRDFENCYALERLADPLAALAQARGAGAGLDAWLEMAWRMELQNHPHDSICGCSVDQVHEDMRYRFDQAAMLAENVVRRASGAILPNGTAIAVFNPTFSRCALVRGELELPDPDGCYVAEGSSGRSPVAVDMAHVEQTFEVGIAAAELKPTVAALSHPTLLGRTINRYEIRHATGGLELHLWLSRAALGDLDLEGFRNRVRNEVPDDARVLIRATNAPRSRISFVARDLGQAGFSFFRLVRDDSAAAAAVSRSDSIENEFYRIRPSGRGLAVEDLRTNSRFELYFEDDGDRGDEYNFDPVAGAQSIVEPLSANARVLDRNSARSRLRLEVEFAIPKSLDAKRHARAPETGPLRIELTASVYAGLDRIDFDATVSNRSRDHRLRVALRTPIVASRVLSDTSFGVVDRPIVATEPPGTEDIYPTAPHRSWSAVESDDVSAAVFSRGLYEVEARDEGAGTTLLLTLLRCVGWLSRSDLAMRRGGAGPELETPGAQEIGEHRFEFAFAAYRGSYLDAGVVQRAAAYAFSPRMFAAAENSSAALTLARCDNPRIAFSTARLTRRDGVYRVRAYSASPNPERAKFSFGNRAKARLINLAGKVTPRRRLRRFRSGDVEIELRPFEIVTFEVSSENRGAGVLARG
ncbi:MAG TPA: glycoside hydrolase family 38 C-terminal domain-containing protein, partial [Candidatus Binataceae bacterium]|nr:glycoside hydrolase family 38 C-terminal domain-containing protein [Candidatus Binataceae bacterium]